MSNAKKVEDSLYENKDFNWWVGYYTLQNDKMNFLYFIGVEWELEKETMDQLLVNLNIQENIKEQLQSICLSREDYIALRGILEENN